MSRICAIPIAVASVTDRVKRPNLVSTVVFVAVLVVAGCSSGSSASSSSSSSSPGAPSGGSSTSSSSSSSATSTTAKAAGTLAVATNAKLAKPVIVDSAGKTVYMYKPDGASTTSQVPAGIRSSWPAVPATDAPTAGTGLDAAKIGSAPQPDGTKQVTYNGHLLYTFVGDAAPGDASGQGLGGVWFTLSPAGEQNA
jgi:predicted lipoprotein with Yx(FWY)xxD motif